MVLKMKKKCLYPKRDFISFDGFSNRKSADSGVIAIESYKQATHKVMILMMSFRMISYQSRRIPIFFVAVCWPFKTPLFCCQVGAPSWPVAPVVAGFTPAPTGSGRLHISTEVLRLLSDASGALDPWGSRKNYWLFLVGGIPTPLVGGIMENNTCSKPPSRFWFGGLLSLISTRKNTAST